MAQRKYAHDIDFVLVEPVCCGVPFMATASADNVRRAKHTCWWCPNCGSSLHYPHESENEKLTRRLEFEKSRREAAEAEAKYQADCARAQKAAKTRLKNRVKNGVCPCCNRSFVNLQQHIATQHPEYK